MMELFNIFKDWRIGHIQRAIAERQREVEDGPLRDLTRFNFCKSRDFISRTCLLEEILTCLLEEIKQQQLDMEVSENS